MYIIELLEKPYYQWTFLDRLLIGLIFFLISLIIYGIIVKLKNKLEKLKNKK